MNKLFKIAIPAAVLALLVGTLAFSDPGRRARRGPEAGERRLQHMTEALDLTDEQRDRLELILERHAEGTAANNREALAEARRALEAVVHDPAADESTIVEAARRLAEETERLALVRHRMFNEISGILTEEQRARAREHFEERMEMRGRPGRPGGGHARMHRHMLHPADSR